MKIICVAKNYPNTSENNNQDLVVFLKPDTAIHNLELPYYIPAFTSELFCEAEIVVKINQNGKCIAEKFAQKYYDEISLGIDFTAQDLQQTLKKQGLPWEKSKSFDGSAVVGKFILKNELNNPNDIAFRLEKNGKLVQESSSGKMLRDINKIISEVSKFFTLRKGDLIFTGTPIGAGKIQESDFLEGFLEDKKMFALHIKK